MDWDLDLRAFRRYLLEKYNVERAYWFVGYLPGREREYLELQEAGFVCAFKPTFRAADGTVKGNCDADLVLRAMIDLPDYQRAILVSGDGDFHCLVEHWLSVEREVKILAPRQQNCSHLLYRFDGRVNISYVTDLRTKLEQKKEPRKD
jgi:uncharacterized LabA/DUF88 family protein